MRSPTAGMVDSGSCPYRGFVSRTRGKSGAMDPKGTERSKTRISGYAAEARVECGRIGQGANGESKPSAGEREHIPTQEVRRPTERCSRRGRPWTLRPPRRPTTALPTAAAGAAGSNRASSRRRPRAVSKRQQKAIDWPRCVPWEGPLQAPPRALRRMPTPVRTGPSLRRGKIEYPCRRPLNPRRCLRLPHLCLRCPSFPRHRFPRPSLPRLRPPRPRFAPPSPR